jgi:predicted phage terminase large subunit-like protein
MALTSAQIYGFAESLLKARYDDPQPTPDFHTELWDLCCSDHKLVAIAAPRGHAKSTCITHAYVLANVLFKEAQYVMIVSDTEEQATLFLEDIKTEILENEDLRTLFKINRLLKDTGTDMIVQFENGDLFRIIAKGSEQKIRGRKWRGKRPDLIVGDDLENDEIVMNEDRRAKFRRWMGNALIPSMSKKGKIRIVGTILHLDSFLERCMPQFEDKETTHTDGLRWWTTKENPVWHSVRYQGHDEEFEQLLWPEMWSRERYEAEKRRYVEDGNPEGYSQEYLNYPIDEDSAFFKPKDFIPWDAYDEYLEYYVGADLAISTRDGRAYTVFVVCGLNRGGMLVVVDVVRFRGDSLEIIDELFRLQRIYEPEVVWIEEENIAKSIGPFIDQAMMQSGVFINIDTDTPSKDKEQRARGIQARMRAGSVRFDTRQPWYQAFYTEMVTFPRGKYMDQVDAFSWVGLGLNKIAPTFTGAQIAQFEYDEEFEDVFDELEGRNATTGY